MSDNRSIQVTLKTVLHISRWLKTICAPAAVILVCFFPDMLSGAETSKRFLTLEQCIGMALDNASSLKKAEQAYMLQGTDLLRSYGRFLPKVSVTTAYTPLSVARTYTDPENETISRTQTERIDFSLTTSLNLFNGFRNYAALRSSMKLREASGLSVEQARQTIAYDITQSYYQVLLDTQLLTIARENLSSSKDQLKLTSRQYEIGLKPVTDFYQQQSETANNELSVIQSENNLRGSRLELLRKLRLDPNMDIVVRDIPEQTLSALPEEVDRDSLVALGKQQRRDLQSSRLLLEAKRWEVTGARSARYPSVDLAFSLSTLAYPYFEVSEHGIATTLNYPSVSEQLTDLPSYSLGLTLNWPLFDGFITRYNIEQAKAGYIEQGLDTADLEHDIAIDIQLAADNYLAAFNQIETAEKGLKAAEKAYETVKKKYDLGAASFVEANAVKASLVRARSEYTQATYNLALQKNILDFTTGTLPVE